MARNDVPRIADPGLYMTQLAQLLEERARLPKGTPIFYGLSEEAAIRNILENCKEIGTLDEGKRLVGIYLAVRHL